MASEEKKPKVEKANVAPRQDFLPGYQTIDKFTQESLKKISLATKASNAIPSDRKEDWDYYNTFKDFRQVMKVQGDTVKNKMLSLLKYNSIKVSNPGDNVADNLEMLSEANDQLLERISMNLDEAEGITKDRNPLLVEVSQLGLTRISGSWNKNMGKSSTESTDNGTKISDSTSSGHIKLLAGKNVMRPQINFRDQIDNSSNPFIPQLKSKPHSKKPLSILIEHDNDGNEFYSHPYLFELDHINWSKEQLEKSSDTMFKNYKDIANVDVIYVDTKHSLENMIAVLKTCNEIGVDVEHHSYRSFQGLSCLIQISTTDKDYILDPFPMWKEGILTDLNEIFANPSIVKILHGAVQDVKWIQRDFSLYIVNMFDTHIAAKILGFPRGCLSLAFLLQNYCNVKTDKKYQLADWRIRPLTREMLQYARSDTRHLIKIYHLMKNALIEKGNENNNLLRSVLDQSRELCKKRHEKPLIRPDDYLSNLRKTNISFNSRQLHAYKDLFDWRNKVARDEDESEMYVLPPHMLLKISSELPREMQGIIACCNPVPPIVKQNLHHLHQIVFKAREKPLTAVPDILGSNATDSSVISCQPSLMNVLENPLKCPLDLSNFQRFQEEDGAVNVLFKSHNQISIVNDNEQLAVTSITYKDRPDFKIFSSEKKANSNSDVVNNINVYLSPFQRFQLLTPYLEAMAIKQEDTKNPNKRTDYERIESIRAHFDALTAMTPDEYNADRLGTSENTNDNISETEESDEADNMLDAYNPDPGKVKSLRSGFADDRREFRKQRKLQLMKTNSGNAKESEVSRNKDTVIVKSESNGQKRNATHLGDTETIKKLKSEDATKTHLDFENADFSQFSSGVKAGKDKQFNPWNGFNKKGKMNQKGKTGKGNTKSFHYKKS